RQLLRPRRLPTPAREHRLLVPVDHLCRHPAVPQRPPPARLHHPRPRRAPHCRLERPGAPPRARPKQGSPPRVAPQPECPRLLPDL
ncbi:hypothetical protein H4R19_006801, partial [Coemansia spiralis]